MISSLCIKLTIDKRGKVAAVEFPGLQAGENCREQLSREMMTMTGWTAGQMDGKYVCSIFFWPIRCLKWE